MAAPRLGPNYAIRQLYCASCRRERDQLFMVRAGELVSVCKCNRTLKWPIFKTREQLEQAFEEHNRANGTQVSV